MSDLTKILAENQKEMLKLIVAPVKKQTVIATTEETDSESENIPENATSTPIKNKTTATNRKITPINSRNTSIILTKKITDWKNVQLTENYEQKGSIRVLEHHSHQGDYAKEHCDEKRHYAQSEHYVQ